MRGSERGRSGEVVERVKRKITRGGVGERRRRRGRGARRGRNRGVQRGKNRRSERRNNGRSKRRNNGRRGGSGSGGGILRGERVKGSHLTGLSVESHTHKGHS